MNVFVVDDEAVISDMLVAILEAKGFLAHAFYNGHDALKAAAEAAPDILISDVVMPQMTGVELAAEFCKHYPACRILLFSGNVSATDLEQLGGGNPGLEILAKPVHPEVLIQRVCAAGRKLSGGN